MAAAGPIPARLVSQMSQDETTAMRGWALNQLLDMTGVHLVFASDTLPVASSMSWVTVLRRLLRLGQHDAYRRERERQRAREINVARPAHSHPTTRGTEPGMIFGSSIEATLQSFGTEHGPLKLRIAKPISTMLVYLGQPDRITTDGIFRVPGAVKRMTELRLLLERDPSLDLEAVKLESGPIRVHDIASLIKTYLRLLPEPLMTDQFERIAAASARVDDEEAHLHTMQLLYMALPPANRDLVEALFRFLNSVTLTGGKMNATNLALVFAPSFQSPMGAKDLDCHRNVVNALKVLITRPDQVFSVELWLRSREKFGYATSGFAVFRQASINRAKSLTRSLSQLSNRSKKAKAAAAAAAAAERQQQQSVSQASIASTAAATTAAAAAAAAPTGSQHSMADSIAGKDLPVSTLQARRSLRASKNFRSLEELTTPTQASASSSMGGAERTASAGTASTATSGSVSPRGRRSKRGDEERTRRKRKSTAATQQAGASAEVAANA